MRTEYDSLYFGGRWLPASTDERITVVSPHTAQTIGSTPCATEPDVDRAVALARHAFDHSPWPHLPPEERAAAVLAPRHRYAETVDALASMVEGIAVGDPSDPSTYVGPLVARRQQERVLGYLQKAADQGARAAVGGAAPPAGVGNGDGWYVAPTLLADVDNAMTVAREEVFGPVVCVIAYDDEDEAVRIANDSPFGLAGSVWSKDRAHAVELARRMRTGMVGINGFAPDLWSPFGGYKQSGIGREYGPVGLDAYLEHKSIYGAP